MDKDKAKKIIKGTVVALGATYVVLDVIAKKQKKDSTYQNDPDQQNPMQGKSVEFIADENDKENADGECGHLESLGPSNASTRHQSAYEKYIKRGLDKGLSFAGLVALAPLMGGIALAIKIEDPGLVLFTQKRVGQDKQYFKLHKFRSMKMSTPHDVPTHMLENPEQYITKVGGFIRKHSLDELPQIWDIFVGNMSVIGPRPALWNQDVLVAERDKVGANDVKPGLTGWAQINGRDELEIPEKARLDGVYTSALEEGSLSGLKMDTKCFAGSIHVFGNDDTVVEGGTGTLEHSGEGALRPGVPSTDPEEHFACDYHFIVDHNSHKNVLIVGKNSYIGDSFIDYAKQHYSDKFTFTVVDTMPSSSDGLSELDKLSAADLAAYDIVYHLAGIAHADVENVDEATKEKYYKVNTDLAIETAKRYKAALEESGRTGLFVFMSSMIVYGDSASYGQERVITATTTPSPANFYGDSKWQADKGIRSLADETMNVAITRPPMIYGKGSKGNYPTLSKLARKSPVFPDVENSRSMLYVGNLCEFLSQMFLSKVSSVDGMAGDTAPNSLIFMPQNGEFTKTSSMVKDIAETVGHRISVVKVLNPAVVLADKVPGKVSGLVDKAFGNNCYDQKLSNYDGLDYQKYSLEKSISLTEGNTESSNQKHILVVAQYFYPEQFRINDICTEWVKRGYKVTVLTGIPNYPQGKFYDGYDYTRRRLETWNGIEIIRIPLIARGSSSIGMVANYLSFVNSGAIWNATTHVNADIVFTYEVSPMTQALIGVKYAKKHHVPHYLYVTDLWPENVEIITGIHNPVVIQPIQKMVDYIYKNTDRIFTSSRSFIPKIIARGVPESKVEFWPQYAEDFYKPVENSTVTEIPQDGITNLVFAGNIGFAQGLGILPDAAGILKTEDVKVRFNIIGDGRYLPELKERVTNEHLEDYFNFISRKPAEEIPAYLAKADALLITLSKSEVFAMTIPAKTQSCLACGRPIILSADGEVQDIIMDAKAGLVSDSEDVNGFVENIKKFTTLSKEERGEMGRNALAYSQSHFSKKKLLDRIDELIEEDC